MLRTAEPRPDVAARSNPVRADRRWRPGDVLAGPPPSNRRQWLATCLAGTVAAWRPWTALADPLFAGDQAARNEAVAAIPFDRLTEQARAKLMNVVGQPSFYRQMPATTIDSDPDLYLFLVRHPEVVVSMWQLMGVTKVSLNRTGAFTFQTNDGAGTAADMELIYGDAHTHVLFGAGAYEGPLFRRRMNGECVVLLRSNFAPQSPLAQQVTNRLDVFLRLENIGADLLAKTLNPVMGKSADHNFVESARFVGQVSQAAARKPDSLRRLAERLANIQPEVRQEFIALMSSIGQRSSQLSQAARRVPDAATERSSATISVANSPVGGARNE